MRPTLLDGLRSHDKGSAFSHRLTSYAQVVYQPFHCLFGFIYSPCYGLASSAFTGKTAADEKSLRIKLHRRKLSLHASLLELATCSKSTQPR